MRDGTMIPLDDEYLVITSDNSGGIGEKEHDIVNVPYDVLSYFAFRVAVMENIALGATPLSVVLHNFCGGAKWEELVSGIERGKRELGMNELTITGSSETNMALLQSALGVVVIGRKRRNELPEVPLSDGIRFAVIGKPLVGDEVVNEPNAIAPLDLFQWVSEQEGVRAVLPVGSKGILYELNELLSDDEVTDEQVMVDLDVHKSSGPSTCFIVAYGEEVEEQLRERAGELFHVVEIRGGQARA